MSCNCMEECKTCHEPCVEKSLGRSYDLGRISAFQTIATRLLDKAGNLFSRGSDDEIAKKIRALGKELLDESKEMQERFDKAEAAE